MASEFGDFSLDEAAYELRCAGSVIPLEPKVFDVLAYLVRHRERVVPKDELLEQLWPGEFVTESVLPANVTQLRRALGDDRSGRFIKTVYGRGYQFVAPVRATSPARRQTGARRSLFVGREAELARLQRALEDALASRGRLVLVVGEPGIGKTRTIDELAEAARERGARVLLGRCYEGEGAPAFWPWVQILRSALRDRAPAVIRAELAHGAPDIAQLVPELRDTLPEIHEPGAAEPEEARFRLFDAVTSYLQGLSTSEPLMLVLDDLHWADKPSLLLLDFLARALRDTRILVVGAYRDVEVRRGQPLAQLLGELTSEPNCLRVALAGLDRDAITAFVERASGTEDPELAGRIHVRTGGNPYFVEEIVRLLESQDERAKSGLPEGVRDAIGRRLDSLSPACNRVLTLASVVGGEFAVALLQQTMGLATDKLFEILDEAVRARILKETPRSLGHYVFEHALVRETLYEELSTPRRAQLHRRIGEALLVLHAEDRDAVLTELAHHFFEATPAGEAERAVEYSSRAADRAIELLAYEEGVGHLERALEALELISGSERRRCSLLLDLGRAWMHAGDRDRWREAFQGAGTLAESIGDGVLLGRAALGFGGEREWGWGPDPELRSMLETARRILGTDDHPVLSRVLARLSGTHPYLNSRERRLDLNRQACEMAERLDDPSALLDAMDAAAFEDNLGMPSLSWAEGRLARAERLCELAERPAFGRDRVIWDPRSSAHDIAIAALLTRGEIAAADREIELTAAAIASERNVHPRWCLACDRFGRAMCDGRYEEAIRHHAEARALARRMNPSTRTITLGHGMVLALDLGVEYAHPILRDPLRAERILAVIQRDFPFIGGVSRALAALIHLMLDHEDDTRRIYELSAADGFVDAKADNTALSTLCLFADLARQLGDADRARGLYDLIAPYADWNVLSNPGSAYLGSAEHFLGMLAGLLGRAADAESHLRRALAFNLRIGSRANAVRTRLELARVLGSGVDGSELLEEADAEIAQLKLAPLALRAAKIREARA